MLTTENHKWFKVVGIKFSFDHVDFWAKTLLLRTHCLWNSTTELILIIHTSTKGWQCSTVETNLQTCSTDQFFASLASWEHGETRLHIDTVDAWSAPLLVLSLDFRLLLFGDGEPELRSEIWELKNYLFLTFPAFF